MITDTFVIGIVFTIGAIAVVYYIYKIISER